MGLLHVLVEHHGGVSDINMIINKNIKIILLFDNYIIYEYVIYNLIYA